MSSPKVFKIALIGCGRISFKHIDAFISWQDKISLVALVDIDPQHLSLCFEHYNHQFSQHTERPSRPPLQYSSIQSLLDAYREEKIDLDLVVLATPSGLHPQQSILCAESGLNVLTEKPMATCWSDGLRMIDAFDRAKKKLFVVKQNRFNPTIQLVKDVISKNELGRIHMVSCNVFWSRPQSYYDSADWRGTWEFDGGALMNQASHYVDLLAWLIGPVDSVQAITATQERQIEVEDSAVLNIKWRNGALGSMSVTMLTYDANLEGSLTVLGSRGSIRVGGKALNKIDMWNLSSSIFSSKDAEASSYSMDSVYGNGHKELYHSILLDLEDREPTHCNGRSGLKSLELLIASYKSAKNQVTVSLPLDF